MPRAPRPTYVRDGIALGAAVGLFGVTYGILATAAGLTVAQTSVTSLLVFTGASQFAAVGIVASGGSPLSALASALMLASRNGIYGLALHQHLHGSVLRRLGMAHLVIDESTAMALGQDEPEHAQRAFIVAGLSVFAFWNLGTLLGALGGNALGDPEAWGLDAAFPAGFIVLAAPHIRSRDGRVAAVAGAVIALCAVPLLPAGAPIVVSSLGAGVALLVRRRRGPAEPAAPSPTDGDT
jgi:4-azaleucine resistance transporter AzlC